MPFYPADWASTMQPALWTWINAVLVGVDGSWSAIWGDQHGPGQTEEGPRPAKPLAVLRQISPPAEVVPTSETELDVSPTRMDLRVRTGGQFTLEVQLYADSRDAIVAAAPVLRASVCADPHTINLHAAGLAVVGPIVDRDLSAVVAGAREFRHVLEFPVRVEMRTDFADQPWIETVVPPVLTVT